MTLYLLFDHDIDRLPSSSLFQLSLFAKSTIRSYTFSTWTGRGGLYLEDLFVTESMRGQGIGKALFGYLGKLCKDLELPRMDWVVLDWNTPAQEVYHRMGARHKKEWWGMRLEGESLAKLAQ